MGDKKEARVKFNKELIMNAAKKMFEEKGILQTTVDDIAREADISKSTLYIYFPSKEEILNAIRLEYMIYLKGLMLKNVNGYKDLKSCYYGICKNLAMFQKKYPVYFDLLLDEIRITKEDIRKQNVYFEIYQVGEEINKIVEDFLKKGIEEGSVRPDIELVPTVFFLWSEISQTIWFANKKAGYFKVRLGLKKEDYMQYGFDMILKSIMA